MGLWTLNKETIIKKGVICQIHLSCWCMIVTNVPLEISWPCHLNCKCLRMDRTYLIFKVLGFCIEVHSCLLHLHCHLVFKKNCPLFYWIAIHLCHLHCFNGCKACQHYHGVHNVLHCSMFIRIQVSRFCKSLNKWIIKLELYCHRAM